jgi:predicted Rossmann fold flavoprotein
MGEIYDILVIGGGPAGMMAAIRAAELGKSVCVLEKNPKPGRKLLLTGGGRCNLTQDEPDTRKLSEAYGKQGKFLLSAFSRFGPGETLDFFHSMGVHTVVEPGGKIYPSTGRALDVLEALTGRMRRAGVRLLTGSEVVGFDAEGGMITGVRTAKGVIQAGNYIVSTGGISYPDTGSTGDGHKWLKSLGHTVTPLLPALAPVTLREKWLREAEGASLDSVRLSLMQEGKKLAVSTGDLVFTGTGLSGPAVLNISATVREAVQHGAADLLLDLYPDTTEQDMDARLMDAVATGQNKLMRNILAEFLPPKLLPVFLNLAEVDSGMQGNALPKAKRLALLRMLKGLTLSVKGVIGFERAMVTAGGVSLKEVDSKTMRSKLFGNLYICGELLDLDGPTGGYNLQMCWSTGWVAGEGAN